VTVSLRPEEYFSQATLAREQETIFRRTWQLAGLEDALHRDGDWIATSVGGRSVVVQSFGGELAAFDNVCIHRGARIRCEPRGNGTLRCAYHGWTYDARGVPVEVPNRASFPSLPPDLSLRRWQVARLGPLVFVRRAAFGPPLDAALKAPPPPLRGAPASFEAVVRANWKLVLEEALERGAELLLFPSLLVWRPDSEGTVLEHWRPTGPGSAAVTAHVFGGAGGGALDARRVANLERLQAGREEGNEPVGADERVAPFLRTYVEFL
jgi:nitrite reductase/ring-hydroxylating ferredoxin subunit